MLRTAILVLALLVGACSAKEAPQETPPEPKAQEPDAAAPDTPEVAVEEPVPAAPPVVKVLAPGKPPRHELRWSLTRGVTQSVTFTTDVRVEMTIDGETRPAGVTPPIAIELQGTVAQVAADGSAVVQFSVAGVSVSDKEGVPPGAVNALRAAANAVVGTSGSYRLDARGFMTDLELVEQSNPPPAVRQITENVLRAVGQMLAQLPEEPVGRGAKWAVDSEVEQAGVTVTQHAEFQVKKLKPPLVTVAVTGSQRAGDQEITGSDGRTAKLKSLVADAKGSARWDLNRLAPLSSTTDSTMTMVMVAPGPDGVQRDVTVVVKQTGSAESP